MPKFLPAAALAFAAIALAAPPASASPPAVLYVSASAKTDPACAAASKSTPFKTVAAALGCAGDGTLIQLGAGQFAGGFTISHNITLQGVASAGGTVISSPGAAPQTITEISDAPGTKVTLRDLTVDGGTDLVHKVPGQRDIYAGAGGLWLNGVTVKNGASYAYSGQGAGGVTAGSSTGHVVVVIQNSTLSSNIGISAGGVGVTGSSALHATLTVADSTIEGNSSAGKTGGGGISAVFGDVALSNSTVDGNAGVSFASGGLYLFEGKATLGNSILAGNSGTLGADCYGANSAVQSLGHNVIGVRGGTEPGNGCGTLANGINGDQVGSAQAPLDAKLAPLAPNGGPTPTQALEPGSPAIAAGDPVLCREEPVAGIDQRLVPRNAPSTGRCDIGAWDSGVPTATLYVSAKSKSDPACAAASKTSPFATIAGALACAGNGTLIKLGVGHFMGGFTIARNVALAGVSGAGRTVISSPGAAPVSLTEITDAPGAHVVLSDLTVDGGEVPKGPFGQRDLLAGEGSLSLIGVTVKDGAADGGAAGIAMTSSTGAVFLNILNSTITGNVALSDGALEAAGPAGAGSALSVDNSTITGNEMATATNAAAGINARQATVSILNTTIDANHGTAVGGLFLLGGAGTIANTIIAGNTGSLYPDCSAPAAALASGGNNVIGVANTLPVDGCHSFLNGVQGDQVGSAGAPLAAKLEALAANGGPTWTQALAPASPAINAGSPVLCGAAPISELDQRGVARNATTRGTCDVGSWDS